MILAIVGDLFFLSKIQQSAGILKVPIEVASPANAGDRARAGSPTAILIDLNHRAGTAVDLIQRIKSDPTTERIPIVGFVSHVQTDLVTAARAAGCDMVLARSAFTKQLPQLLEELSGRQSESASK